VVGIPELAGLVLAAVVVARTRNVLAGLLAAMGIFWLLRHFLS
jgi:branched-subunit amino acid transport protein